MARKARGKIKKDELVQLKVVRQVLGFRNQLLAPDPHGNVKLQFIDALVVLLAGFFNPTVRSLRLIEQLSQIPWVNQQLGVERVCRSTLSDAFKRFDPQQLRPVMEELIRRVPQLGQKDADLQEICRQVVAADGSLFTLAGEVAWALRQQRTNGQPLSQPRLDLQLDIASFTPVDLSVAGRGEGSEAARLLERIQPGVIYLLDRYYVHFGLLEKIFQKQADVVLRLRSDTNFTCERTLELSTRDTAAGVLSDRIGHLPGSGGRPGGKSRTTAPPPRPLREVMLRDPDGGEVRLLTSLLDVPAYVIGALYRNRWQIELFFRWLKVVSGFGHLISQSQEGITIELYVAVIGCLLMHLKTGMQVNKYMLFLMGQVAAGNLTFAAALPMLQRIEREKALEKARRARKQLAAGKN